MMDRPILGTFVCPHQDGDYTLTVEDLAGWWTGACMVRQVGQGDDSTMVLTKDEAGKLATILQAFANS